MPALFCVSLCLGSLIWCHLVFVCLSVPLSEHSGHSFSAVFASSASTSCCPGCWPGTSHDSFSSGQSMEATLACAVTPQPCIPQANIPASPTHALQWPLLNCEPQLTPVLQQSPTARHDGVHMCHHGVSSLRRGSFPALLPTPPCLVQCIHHELFHPPHCLPSLSSCAFTRPWLTHPVLRAAFRDGWPRPGNPTTCVPAPSHACQTPL